MADDPDQLLEAELLKALARFRMAREAYRAMLSDAGVGELPPGNDGVLLVRKVGREYQSAQEDYLRAIKRHLEYIHATEISGPDLGE